MKVLKNPLIFLVEDDPAFRKLIEVHLKSQNYKHIKTFDSGEACIKHLQESEDKPTVVIQDFDLEGGMNGLEAMKAVKQILPDTEYLFLSGQNSIEVAVSVLNEGAYDYVIKDNVAKQNISHRLKRLLHYKSLIHDRKLSKIAIRIISSGFIVLSVLLFLYWVFKVKPCP